MDDAGNLMRAAPEGEPAAFYWVDYGAEDQLFFMLGLPMIHLLRLEALTGSSSYRAGAERLLDACEACGDPLYRSLLAHKVARAAARLAVQTGSARAHRLARRIGDFLASLQQPNGSFFADATSLDAFDQTAELALWLREIHDELAELQVDEP